MGMFDRMYDDRNNEWQTKAYGCNLDRFEVGESLPGPPIDYQVKIFGGRRELGEPVDSFATVHGGRLASINDPRDESLHLLDYHGGWISAGKKN